MHNFISLNLYDENDEVIKTVEKSIVKWGVMKKAIRLGKGMDVENFEEADFDKITQFVCEVFDNKVSVKELEDSADMQDVFAVFKAIINKANTMNISPN
jgi:hypothetical protein